jgi:hypothetical protein
VHELATTDERSGNRSAHARPDSVVAHRRDRIRSLLARWRAADRTLQSTPRGTEAWLQAREEFEEARRAYLAEAQPSDD